MQEKLFGSIDVDIALDDLRRRNVNYDPALAPLDGRADGHWHVDSSTTVIGREPPGPPMPGGVWETARTLVRRYEFTDPHLLRAVYRRDDDLLGRDMLLEGRFFALRFYFGVRVTSVIDDTRRGGDAPERVWGWSYQTLEGHLEEGRLSYEVIKDLGSGIVTFRISGYSRRAVIVNPLVRWGFRLFGRRSQERFYRSAQTRLQRLVVAPQPDQHFSAPAAVMGGLVLAPSSVAPHPLDRLSMAWKHPGQIPGRHVTGSF